MGKGQHLGEFEQITLLAVARCQPTAHGAAVHRELTRTTGRDVSLSTVYVTLNRLEEKDYLRAAVELAEKEHGGRPRKTHQLTPKGVEQLRKVRMETERLWEGLPFDPVRGS